MTKDLTEGKPFSLILMFTIPILFGNLFQQFYNLVDTIIVGKFLGVESLAGVGSTGAINFLIIGFCTGVGNGFALPVAQKFGGKNYKVMRQYVGVSVLLGIIFCAVMTVVTVIFCKPLLVLMNTPKDIFNYAYQYIVIIFAGIPVLFMYNLLSGIIRALGDSKTPVIFLVIASILNIALDLIFIIVFKAGVAGAALATVLAQAVSGLLCLIYMIKKFEILHLCADDWKFRKHHAYILCSMGLPMGLQYSITAIGSVILQTAVNTLGSNAVAAVTAASRISMLFCCPFDAMGATMATYGGQNTGAQKLDRLKAGTWACSKIGIIYSIIAFLILLFWGRDLGLLFLNASNTEILDSMYKYLVISSSFFIPLAFVNIVRFMIQGMGFSKFAVFAGVFELFGRAAVAKIFVPIIGFDAVCFASPAAWILADCFLIPAFFSCYRKLVRIQKADYFVA